MAAARVPRSSAKFTISTTASSPKGYNAVADEVLNLQLETQPPLDTRSCVYSMVKKVPAGAPSPTFSNGGVPTPSVGSIVTCTMPGAGAGMVGYLLRCQTNGGEGVILADGTTSFAQNTYERFVVILGTSSGLRLMFAGESSEYSEDGWAELVNDLALKIETLSLALAGATVAATAGKLPIRDGDGGFNVGYLKDGDGAAHPTAFFRFGLGPTVIMGGKASSGAASRSFLAYEDGELHVGFEAESLDLDAKGLATMSRNGGKQIAILPHGIAFFNSTASLADGQDIFFIKNATTAPTTPPAAGAFVWVSPSDQSLRCMTPNGIRKVLVPLGSAAVAGPVPFLGDSPASLSTANNTPTTILSWNIAADQEVVIPCRVIARNTTGRALFEFTIFAGRVGGAAPTLTSPGIIAPTLDPAGLGVALNVNIASNTVVLQVVGDPLLTTRWSARGQEEIWG